MIKHFFTGSDNIIDLIREDHKILPVLSRFSVPLGFGDKTISRLCRDASISEDLFLVVVNLTINGRFDKEAAARLSPTEVARFLHKSHDYFLNYKFPHIRTNLLAALDESHKDINPIIVRFYDDFIRHVERHFDYEETVVFPYVKSIEEGESSNYNISIFRHQHDEVGDTLRELKNIILRYYATSRPDVMYDVLVDIYDVEDDLDSHSLIENNILVPLVASLEKKRRTRNSHTSS